VIESFLIPGLAQKNDKNTPSIKIHRFSERNIGEKYGVEKPYEEMTKEEQNELAGNFMMKFAEFLFATNKSVQTIMQPKIFDKVIDGTEHRLIKYKHFIRLLKRAGLGLTYNDEQCTKMMIQETLPG
jgi:hypothetical protein